MNSVSESGEFGKILFLFQDSFNRAFRVVSTHELNIFHRPYLQLIMSLKDV